MSARRWTVALGSIALLALTAGVAATVPDTDLLEAPFPTHGRLGDTISGRLLEATLTDARFADELRADDWHGTTNGTWLVADLQVAGVVERANVFAVLEVDGAEYVATDRVSFDSLTERVVDPMLPIVGLLAIEVPAELVDAPGAKDAVLVLQPSIDARLESVLEFRIDLTQLEHVARVEIESPREVAR